MLKKLIKIVNVLICFFWRHNWNYWTHNCDDPWCEEGWGENGMIWHGTCLRCGKKIQWEE